MSDDKFKEFVDFFQNAKMFFIATTEEDQPRVRPFGHLVEYHGQFYFNTGKHKNVYQQLMKNPKVEICAFDKGVWYRVAGCAAESDNEEIKQMMMEIDPVVKRNYGQDTSDLAIFGLVNVKSYRCTFASNELVYEE